MCWSHRGCGCHMPWTQVEGGGSIPIPVLVVPMFRHPTITVPELVLVKPLGLVSFLVDHALELFELMHFVVTACKFTMLVGLIYYVSLIFEPFVLIYPISVVLKLPVLVTCLVSSALLILELFRSIPVCVIAASCWTPIVTLVIVVVRFRVVWVQLAVIGLVVVQV
jgi:hypothetical protein